MFSCIAANYPHDYYFILKVLVIISQIFYLQGTYLAGCLHLYSRRQSLSLLVILMIPTSIWFH